jgi:hypothetical protein
MLRRVQVTDTSQHQLFRGACVEQAFMVELLQRNHYLRTQIKRRAKKHEQWTLDRWKSVSWSEKSNFETQSRRTDDLRICGSHREAWRKRCDGPLLVTMSAIYLEFKAHLTSLATTAFCSDTPSHLFCA